MQTHEGSQEYDFFSAPYGSLYVVRGYTSKSIVTSNGDRLVCRGNIREDFANSVKQSRPNHEGSRDSLKDFKQTNVTIMLKEIFSVFMAQVLEDHTLESE